VRLRPGGLGVVPFKASPSNYQDENFPGRLFVQRGKVTSTCMTVGFLGFLFFSGSLPVERYLWNQVDLGWCMYPPGGPPSDGKVVV